MQSLDVLARAAEHAATGEHDAQIAIEDQDHVRQGGQYLLQYLTTVGKFGRLAVGGIGGRLCAGRRWNGGCDHWL